MIGVHHLLSGAQMQLQHMLLANVQQSAIAPGHHLEEGRPEKRDHRSLQCYRVDGMAVRRELTFINATIILYCHSRDMSTDLTSRGAVIAQAGRAPRGQLIDP
jgi:hypothetical protein